MSQSLYTAMGGISAAQTELNVISNNIANLNTTAFKTSSVTFSDVFSRTISSGSVSTESTGGTNPVQVGVGVKVSAISKDFNSGSWIATGKTTDLMVEGLGFFTVESSDGEKYYTRAGDFSFDEEGYLVTSSGYKLMGTNNILSSTTTESNVYIPRSIIATKTGNVAIANQALTDLNNCDTITSGYFNITTNNTDTLRLHLDTTANNTVGMLVGDIQTQIDTFVTALQPIKNTALALDTATDTAAAAGAGLTAPQIADIDTAADNAIAAANTALTAGTITQNQHTSILASANAAIAVAGSLSAGTAMTTQQRDALLGYARNVGNIYDEFNNITVTCDATTNGRINFAIDGTTTQSLSFSNPTGMTATNFITATGMNNATLNTSTHTYTSNILDWTVAVSQVTSASLADSNPTCSINADGSIQATYSSGDTLSVQLDDTGTSYEFLYTTSAGIEISGTKCTVDTNVAEEANFVIQMASITNTDGLLSVGGNLFKAGPNSGSVLYSVGGKLGLGKIQSGGLEASNVDLSEEFSNMIVAQRAVQANSRVFTTTSNIMDIIVSMGR